jgi:CelD/BcsL family acetyltransferase involved in cellulose biosynthesis
VTVSFVEPAIEQLLVERIVSVAEMASLAEEWNALAQDVPFLRHEWLETWWRHYGSPSQELFIIALRTADGELVGVAPWYRTTLLSRLRVVRQLGSGEVASDYVGLLAHPDHTDAVAREISRWLVEDGAGEWDLIDIDAVRADDPAFERLIAELRVCGHLVDRRLPYRTWKATLAATWDGYLATISKSRREQTRRFLRRSVDTGRAVVRCVEHEDELPQGWRILADLHQRRRVSLGDAGCFSSPRFVQFHTEVARRFLDLGRLRLRWLEIGGKPAAVEYGFTGGDTIYYYQSGIDPALAEESPGWISLATSLRSAIEDGYRFFDFLRGDEPYKASLGGQPVPLARIRIVGRSLLARTHYRAWLAGSRAKGLVKRGWQKLQTWRRSAEASHGKGEQN